MILGMSSQSTEQQKAEFSQALQEIAGSESDSTKRTLLQLLIQTLSLIPEGEKGSESINLLLETFKEQPLIGLLVTLYWEHQQTLQQLEASEVLQEQLETEKRQFIAALEDRTPDFATHYKGAEFLKLEVFINAELQSKIASLSERYFPENIQKLIAYARDISWLIFESDVEIIEIGSKKDTFFAVFLEVMESLNNATTTTRIPRVTTHEQWETEVTGFDLVASNAWTFFHIEKQGITVTPDTLVRSLVTSAWERLFPEKQEPSPLNHLAHPISSTVDLEKIKRKYEYLDKLQKAQEIRILKVLFLSPEMTFEIPIALLQGLNLLNCQEIDPDKRTCTIKITQENCEIIVELLRVLDPALFMTAQENPETPKSTHVSFFKRK